MLHVDHQGGVMITCAVEKEHDRNRSVIEIYERVGIGGVHIDRPEPTSTHSAPRERIRSYADDKGPKLPARRCRETLPGNVAGKLSR
jgi:hypothetical protein